MMMKVVYDRSQAAATTTTMTNTLKIRSFGGRFGGLERDG
jgi:hypothetical protein